MKSGIAFWAGVVGGAVMSLIMIFARLMGLPVNVEMSLGTMFNLEIGLGTWFFGLFLHLFISGVVALLYGLGFEYITHKAGAGRGVLFSLVHIMIAGFFMGLMPAMHPQMPQQISSPGLFMANLGIVGVIAFIMIHLIYGAIVGGMYGSTIPRGRVANGSSLLMERLRLLQKLSLFVSWKIFFAV